MIKPCLRECVILKDADLRAKISHRCREVAVREYSHQSQAQRYAELYKALIAEAGRAG